MGTPGIDPSKTSSTPGVEVEKVGEKRGAGDSDDRRGLISLGGSSRWESTGWYDIPGDPVGILGGM